MIANLKNRRIFFCVGLALLIFSFSHAAWAQKGKEDGSRNLINQLSDNRTSRLYKTCMEDVRASGNDNDKFVDTKCGFYIFGFLDGGISMEYFLGDQVGKFIKREDQKLIKTSPYCFNKDISSLDVAKALIEYVDENPPKEMGEFTLTVALKEKYPCK